MQVREVGVDGLDRLAHEVGCVLGVDLGHAACLVAEHAGDLLHRNRASAQLGGHCVPHRIGNYVAGQTGPLARLAERRLYAIERTPMPSDHGFGFHLTQPGQEGAADRHAWPILLGLMPPRWVEFDEAIVEIDLEATQLEDRLRTSQGIEGDHKVHEKVFRLCRLEERRSLVQGKPTLARRRFRQAHDEGDRADLLALPSPVEGRTAD
ncbi:MAG: hypothetical protein QNJ67_13585 [Kiloniellales bacterium]|nr:hypothetical protein [Kiloniellales bacterium]